MITLGEPLTVTMITTRVITGCGVPQLTAVALCVEIAREHKVNAERRRDLAE